MITYTKTICTITRIYLNSIFKLSSKRPLPLLGHTSVDPAPHTRQRSGPSGELVVMTGPGRCAGRPRGARRLASHARSPWCSRRSRPSAAMRTSPRCASRRDAAARTCPGSSRTHPASHRGTLSENRYTHSNTIQ